MNRLAVADAELATVAIRMVRAYGKRAAAEARQRSTAFRVAGDSLGANTWNEISHYIEARRHLAPSEIPDRQTLHAEKPQ